MRAALVALLLTTAPALAGSLPAEPGLPFLAARQRMIHAGWSEGPAPVDAGRCGIGWEDVCKTYEAEVITCRGTGTAGCTFVYWKGDDYAVIRTQGEEVDHMRVVVARVLSARERKKLDAGQFVD
ncbi:hypothetical protein [Heyndrickxia sporothermodurans]